MQKKGGVEGTELTAADVVLLRGWGAYDLVQAA